MSRAGQVLSTRRVQPYDPTKTTGAPIKPSEPFEAIPVTTCLESTAIDDSTKQIIQNISSRICKLSLNGNYLGCGILIKDNIVLAARHCVEGLFITNLKFEFNDTKSTMCYTGLYAASNSTHDYVLFRLQNLPYTRQSKSLTVQTDEANGNLLLFHYPAGCADLMVSRHKHVSSGNHERVGSILETYHPTYYGSSGGMYVNSSSELIAMHLGVDLIDKPSSDPYSRSANLFGIARGQALLLSNIRFDCVAQGEAASLIPLVNRTGDFRREGYVAGLKLNELLATQGIFPPQSEKQTVTQTYSITVNRSERQLTITWKRYCDGDVTKYLVNTDNPNTMNNIISTFKAEFSKILEDCAGIGGQYEAVQKFNINGYITSDHVLPQCAAGVLNRTAQAVTLHAFVAHAFIDPDSSDSSKPDYKKLQIAQSRMPAITIPVSLNKLTTTGSQNDQFKGLQNAEEVCEKLLPVIYSYGKQGLFTTVANLQYNDKDKKFQTCSAKWDGEKCRRAWAEVLKILKDRKVITSDGKTTLLEAISAAAVPGESVATSSVIVVVGIIAFLLLAKRLFDKS